MPNIIPESDKSKIYIPESIANNFSERLANKYVPAIAGRIQTTEIRKPVNKPVTIPRPETTELNAAKARKCITAVPPKISGAFISFLFVV